CNALVTATNHSSVSNTFSVVDPGHDVGTVSSTTPYVIATATAATCPASFQRAGTSSTSSRSPAATMIVAPSATPLSCSENVKLKSTVAAKAAYTAAPPSSGVATACTLRAAGASSTPQ